MANIITSGFDDGKIRMIDIGDENQQLVVNCEIDYCNNCLVVMLPKGNFAERLYTFFTAFENAGWIMKNGYEFEFLCPDHSNKK